MLSFVEKTGRLSSQERVDYLLRKGVAQGESLLCGANKLKFNGVRVIMDLKYTALGCY